MSVMLALAEDHITMWWVTLGLGAVVIIAVIVLLSLLVALVDDIDVNVREVWDTATRLAANTATTWMFQQTTTRPLSSTPRSSVTPSCSTPREAADATAPTGTHRPRDRLARRRPGLLLEQDREQLNSISANLAAPPSVCGPWRPSARSSAPPPTASTPTWPAPLAASNRLLRRQNGWAASQIEQQQQQRSRRPVGPGAHRSFPFSGHVRGGNRARGGTARLVALGLRSLPLYLPRSLSLFPPLGSCDKERGREVVRFDDQRGRSAGKEGATERVGG